MPNDAQSHGGRRPHFHRGRRGQERRGDRRPQASTQTPAEPHKSDGIDVDQLVRQIKARIAERHGIDLSAAQIQELAARRLEAILDPRTVKPSLLEQLRLSAGASPNIAPVEPAPAYTFEDHTLYDTHNGLLRGIRALLRPVLKLFFNPNPIAHALNAQARVNKEAAAREEARERTQTEWNALHFTLVKQLVTEIARVTLEAQSLALRVESLSARVDAYERRVRGLEDTPQTAAAAVSPPSHGVRPVHGGADTPGASDSPERRRRRRRRGRRGPGMAEGGGPGRGDQTADDTGGNSAPEVDDDGSVGPDAGPEASSDASSDAPAQQAAGTDSRSALSQPDALDRQSPRSGDVPHAAQATPAPEHSDPS